MMPRARNRTVAVVHPTVPVRPSSDRTVRIVNPTIRYATVPVDETGDGRNDVAYIVRGRRKKDAIRDVANEVDADAWIDIDQTRTFPTKHEATEHARAVASRVTSLYRRVARGGD